MIYCDNTSVVANTKEPRAYKAAKHIERKYHLIQQFVKRGHIIVVDIASKDNRADPFMKCLPAKAFRSTWKRYQSDTLSHSYIVGSGFLVINTDILKEYLEYKWEIVGVYTEIFV